MTFATSRFWTLVNKDGPTCDARPDLGPCWVWMGSMHRLGYGQFCCSRAKASASSSLVHRRHWIETHGPMAKGLDLDHICRNRACLRLSHLELVTHAENCRRGLNGRLRPVSTACSSGHSRDVFGTRGAKQWTCRECHRLKAKQRREASPRVPRKARTHCPRGHAYDMTGGHGERACRTCMNAQGLAYYHRKRAEIAAAKATA